MTAEPRTILDLFSRQVLRSRDRIALRHKLGGSWRGVTWQEWDQTSQRAAAGLLALGIAPSDTVAILASTRVQWVQADVACWMARAVTVPIYASSTPETVAFVCEDAAVRVLFAEDPLQVEKLFASPHTAQFDRLRTIVVFDRIARQSAPDARGRLDVRLEEVVPEAARGRVIGWSELLELGATRLREQPSELAALRSELEPDALASIVYTSGTGAEPKGVLLTHAHFVAEAAAVRARLDVGPDDEQLLFLPLAHILGRITVVLQMACGFTTSFAQSILHAADDCAELKPTFFVTVPRLLEKVHETVLHVNAQSGSMKQRVFRWATGVGAAVSRLEQQRAAPTGLLAVQHRYADRLVFRPIQQRLGGRLRFIVSGGAPLAKPIAEFFHAAGLLVLEGYGLTESTGAATVNTPSAYRFGSVGKPMDGIELRVATDGELLLRGATITRGYHGKPDDTRAAIDQDGWLHTGDVGRVDGDGFVFITDRKKDLIVTAGGKKVAPQLLEFRLTQSRYVAQAIVVGEGRKHLAALLVPDRDALLAFAREQGLVGDVASLAKHPRVRELYEHELDRVNQGLASFETIKKFALVTDELSAESGALTPTLKLKRRAIDARYAGLIESLYAD